MYPLFIGVVVAGIGAFAGAMVASGRSEKQHRQRLADWARGHGWRLVERPGVDWADRLPGRWRDRQTTDALFGTVEGREVAVAEVRVMPPRNGRVTIQQPRKYTAYMVKLRGALQPVEVARRRPAEKFGLALEAGIEAFGHIVTGAAPETLPAQLVTEHTAGILPDWSVVGDELITWRTGPIEVPDPVPTELIGVLRIAELLEARA
jgi:hypothetical protein